MRLLNVYFNLSMSFIPKHFHFFVVMTSAVQILNEEIYVSFQCKYLLNIIIINKQVYASCITALSFKVLTVNPIFDVYIAFPQHVLKYNKSKATFGIRVCKFFF